jgi:hypothetical protein
LQRQRIIACLRKSTDILQNPLAARNAIQPERKLKAVPRVTPPTKFLRRAEFSRQPKVAVAAARKKSNDANAVAL